MVVVVGGGQAGLAVSRELSQLGVVHVVLERDRVASSWRALWDSFCLNTPNWTLSLPGSPYTGEDTEGFQDRAGVVAYLEGYAASHGLRVESGVEVTELAAAPCGFRLHTSAGEISAAQVVVATGGYQLPRHALPFDAFPSGLLVIDAAQYTNPAALPPGRVLVLGSGSTGMQIAEDLALAGQEVFLACGRAPCWPRRLEAEDIFTWVARTGFLDAPVSTPAHPQGRLQGTPVSSGVAGGHDLDHRVLRRLGVTLLGHLQGIEGRRLRFAPDLTAIVAFSDQAYAEICQVLQAELPRAGYAVPSLPAPEPFVAAAPEELDLDGFGAVIHACGYRPDHQRWVKVPVFDEMGFPITLDGSCPAAPGLHFLGLRFQRKRKSSFIFGVAEDAQVVARSVAGLRFPGNSPPRPA